MRLRGLITLLCAIAVVGVYLIVNQGSNLTAIGAGSHSATGQCSATPGKASEGIHVVRVKGVPVCATGGTIYQELISLDAPKLIASRMAHSIGGIPQTQHR